VEDRVKVLNSREYPNRPVVGEWSIPGGMLEIGETIFEGVRRELAEETGMDVRVVDLIEVFERISLDGEGKPKYHYVVLDYFCEAIRGKASAGSDAGDVAWATEDSVGEYALSASANRVIKKAFEMARIR
jgi:8-oxo-dGTP diphosphatase